MSSTAQVFIDEIEVTDIAVEGSWTRRLNRPSEAQVKLPMKQSIGGAGSLLKLYIDGILKHHGRVLLCEVSPQTDTGYTVYNSTDPFELWQWRPVRDPDGDFSKPSIIQDFVTGPQIVEAMMQDSENAGAGPPSDAEGPLFLVQGSFAAGGVDMTGAPVDWPMTMAQLATLLVGTGELDLVITPIEYDIDGNYGQLDAYNGDYGMDLSTSVAFQYGMGAFNVQSLRWNEDMTNMCNKLWYYLGPKCDDQHWQANITGDDPGLAYPPGGALSPPASSMDNQIGAQNYTSRNAYGVRMEIKIFDAAGDDLNCSPGGTVAGHDLYRRLWQIESWLRAQPQTLVHVTPTRDTEIGSFDIGDLVLVEAVAAVKGGFSGVQRVYEYTVSWNATDSVPALSELQTSATQEGFS